MAAPLPWTRLTPPALAHLRATPGMTQAIIQGMGVAQVAEENNLWSPATLKAEQVATAARKAVELAALVKLLRSRPRADAQPSDQIAWLKANLPGWSPMVLWPEFGWSRGADGKSGSASFDLAPGDHVSWYVNPDGSYGYHHTWGGFDVGRSLESIASDVALGAAAIGWVPLAGFIHVLTAIAYKEPLSSLGQALKDDWDTLGDEVSLATALVSGDWQKAWDAATNFGKDLTKLQGAFAPGNAPDRNGNLSIPPLVKTPSPATKGTPHVAVTIIGVGQKLPPAIQKAIVAAQPANSPAAARLRSAFGMPPEQNDAILLATPPPPAAAVPWYSKKIVGPVTVAEAGGAVAALGALWKWVL